MSVFLEERYTAEGGMGRVSLSTFARVFLNINHYTDSTVIYASVVKTCVCFVRLELEELIVDSSLFVSHSQHFSATHCCFALFYRIRAK